jgi:hypothetical protein
VNINNGAMMTAGDCNSTGALEKELLDYISH